MAIGLLILRVVVGALMIGHGTQKLFGWFGGGGITGTAAALDRVGLRSRSIHPGATAGQQRSCWVEP